MESSGLRARFPGDLAIGHSVALLDEHASLRALKFTLASIDGIARWQNYAWVFFFSSDRRLQGLYERFGMSFSDDLTFPDSTHLVGVYELGCEANRDRAERAPDRERGRVTWSAS